MKKLLAGLLLSSLLISCSANKNLSSEANQHEKFGLSDEFKGDYLLYSGRMVITNESDSRSSDSLNLVELAIDKDNRFALRIRLVDATIKNDTTEVHYIGAIHNICLGEWEDKGAKIELYLPIGTVDDFFDIEKDGNILEVVNDSTALLDKSAEAIWILRSLCKRE